MKMFIITLLQRCISTNHIRMSHLSSANHICIPHLYSANHIRMSHLYNADYICMSHLSSGSQCYGRLSTADNLANVCASKGFNDSWLVDTTGISVTKFT